MPQDRPTKDRSTVKTDPAQSLAERTPERLRQRWTEYIGRLISDLYDMSEPGVVGRKILTAAAAAERADPNRNINRLRKFGCTTDGKDPFAFLERVAELKKTYGITDEEFLRGAPELLRGQAQAW